MSYNSQVKISANDTKVGYLADELVASTGVLFSVSNVGGDESLNIAISQSIASTDSPTFNDITLTSLNRDFTTFESDIKTFTGIPSDERGKFKIDISYSSPNVIATLSFVGANTSFSYYIKGIKYDVTSLPGDYTASATAAEGTWFVYINSSNVFTLTQIPWSINNPDVLLWDFYYDATNNRVDWIGEERHTAGRDIFNHARNHAQGAILKSGFLASQANGLTNFAGDTQNSPGRAQVILSNGNFFDEDILNNITHSDAAVNASTISPETNWNLNVNQFLGFTDTLQAGTNDNTIVFSTTRTVVTGQSVTVMVGNSTTIRGSSLISEGGTNTTFSIPAVTGTTAGDVIVLGARIPIYYIASTSPYVWRKLAATSFLGVTGGNAYSSSNIATDAGQYNNASAGGFSALTAGKYYPVYLMATNFTFEPIIAILGQGQSVSSTLSTALGEAPFQFSNLVGLSNIGIQEAVPFYRLTFEYNSGGTFSNTRLKLKDATFLNIRLATVSGQVIGSAPSVYPAGSILTDTTNFDGKLSPTDTTVQLALDTLDDHSHTAAELNVISSAVDIGSTGVTVFAGKSSTGLQFKQIIASTGIVLSQNDGNVVIGASIDDPTTASNIGDGTGVFYQKLGSDLEFKTLKSSTNVIISYTSTAITIGAIGGSGGSGTSGLSFFMSGNAYVAEDIMYIRIPKDFTISKVIISTTTAPTGAALTVDVNYADYSSDSTQPTPTTIFTTQASRPSISDGNYSADSGTPDITAVTAGGVFSFSVDAVGSTVTGANLMVTIVAV